MVASSLEGVAIDITRDGKPLGSELGKDFLKTNIIKDERLYELINGSDYGQHTIEITTKGSGLRVFTFTFG